MDDMKYKRLGDSGLSVSVLGYGANNLGRKGSVSEDITGAKKVVDAARDAGVTYFDTANNYGYEAGLSE
ncbi:MAG: aldo/keto reductase, partial [Varibaculum cambriense]|nr:aldo/keto reductase [Varibaculum cambriense]